MASIDSLPPIAIGTPMARELQARIQRALASKAWAEEGDDVMAEYVLVMLANNKTAPQINAELSDLIGADYSEDFTQWLWTERASLADGGGGAAAAEAPAAPVAYDGEGEQEYMPVQTSSVHAVQEQPRSRSPVQDRQRRRSYDRRSASPGAAPAGPRQGVASRWQRSPQQEQRGAWGRSQEMPAHQDRWGQMDPSRQARNGWGAAREQRRELFGEPSRRPDDSMAGPSRPLQTGMASDALGLGVQPQGRATSGEQLPPSGPRTLRVKGVAQTSLFQRSLGQAQSQSVQQPQQPQHVIPPRPAGQAASPSLFSRMSVPDPRAAPFQPLGVASAPTQPVQPSVPPVTGFASITSLLSRIDPMVPENPLPSSSPTAVGVVPTIDPSTFPSKPIHTSLCRYGTRCSDPTCQYSHPSVAAVAKARQTGEEPLILNSQACNFQENCTRPDCDRGHISPSVVFIKAKLERENMATLESTFNGGTSTTTAACKFQEQCTNPSCTFAHFDGAGNVRPSPALSRMATHSNSYTANAGTSGNGFTSLPQSEHDGMEADDDVDFTMDAEVGNSVEQDAQPSTDDAASLKARLDARLDRPLGSGNGFGSSTSAASSTSSIPCRFGAACYREDCHFQHPLGRKSQGSKAVGNQNGTKIVDESSSRGLGPCRYGLGCNRPDCHFSHPSGHIVSSSNTSNPGSATTSSKPHISDRLARFGEHDEEKENGKGESEMEMERILPGSGLSMPATTDGMGVEMSSFGNVKREGDVVDLE